MGSRWGSDERCSVCGLTYPELRTGETFASVRKQRVDGQHKRLYSVLGHWHGLKLHMWNEHVDRCWAYSGHRGTSPDRVAFPMPLGPRSARATRAERRRASRATRPAAPRSRPVRARGGVRARAA